MSNTHYADYGNGKSMAFVGPDGDEIDLDSVTLPDVEGGEFVRKMAYVLLNLGDLCIENSTPGSSGVEKQHVQDVLGRVPHRLFTISNRAVKNHRHRTKSGRKVGAADEHVQDATILFEIGSAKPDRMKRWIRPRTRLARRYRSVRPHDKRDYLGPEVDEFMSVLPPLSDLPADIRSHVDKGRRKDRVSRILPLAMAMHEPAMRGRGRRTFESLIGLSEHGHGSFYRRATVTWMQRVAGEKVRARMGDVKPKPNEAGYIGNKWCSYATDDEIKAAWRITQRQIRTLFRLMRDRRGHLTHDATSVVTFDTAPIAA